MKTTLFLCAVLGSPVMVSAQSATNYDTVGIESGLGGLRGNSECLADLRLAFAVSGLVAQVPVKEGDTVQQGMVLAALDRGIETLEVARRLTIWKNRAEIDAAEIKSQVAGQQYNAAQELQASGGAISAEEVQNRKLARDLGAVELAGLETQEKIQEMDYKTAQDSLAKRSMKAPTFGIISEIIKKPGESVQAYEPVIRMCDMTKIIFVANLPDLNRPLAQGDQVMLQLTNQIDPIAAKVTFVSPVVDAASGLRKYKFDLPSGLNWLRPGLTAELFLGP